MGRPKGSFASPNRARAEKLLARGMSLAEAARELGLSRERVRQYFPELAGERQEERRDKVLEAFVLGLSRTEAAALAGYAFPNHVDRISRELGLGSWRQEKEIQHGTRNGYSYRGCRCTECRAANAQWAREWREKRREGR